MIKVSVIKKHYQVKVGAKNIVTSCDPATVTATNSDSTVLGTATVPSGGTGNIPIADSEIRRSDASLIVSLPATEPATIQDSVVNIEYQNGTPISTNSVMADSTATFQVPNPLKDATANFPFPVGTDTLTATIVAATNETYTSNTLTNVTTVTYTLNGTPVTLPFTVANGNTLIVTITRVSPQDPAAASLVILNGSYV
jgi:hypothetical protein